MVSIPVVARLTEPNAPADPPVANTAARVDPSLETEWQAMHRLPEPLSSHGGVCCRPPSGKSGLGLPDSHGSVPQSCWSVPGCPEPGLKTVETCPTVRSALSSCPWLMFQK